MTTCKHCRKPVHVDAGVWVDESGGDVCGWDGGNEPHEVEGQWTTVELTRAFEVVGFAAPYVVVIRNSDGAKGSLMFAHSPRVYSEWRAD